MGGFLSQITGTNNGYQAEAAPITRQDFKPGLEQSAGQFNSVFNNQSNLAQQLQAMANGQGPNPAQVMLHQATNRNIQQNAGMLAGQKTLSPALAQRLIAMNAANAGQQAAGQGALMGAQQQVAAQQGLAGVYGQQQQGALGMQGTLQNAQAAQNNALVGMQSNINNANLAASQGNQGVRAGLVGGVMNSIGGGISGMMGGKAHGGMIGYADGGEVAPMWGYNNQPSVEPTPMSFAANMLAQGTQGLQKGMSGMFPKPTDAGKLAAFALSDGGEVPGQPQFGGDDAKNDTVPAALSPGEIVIPRSITMHPNAPHLAAQFVQQELHKHRPKQAGYADGGEIPASASPQFQSNQLFNQLPDPTAVPSQMFPDVSASPQFQSNQLFNQIRGVSPGEPEAFSRASADSVVGGKADADYRSAHGLAPFAHVPSSEGAPTNESPSSPDQGPANMPQQPIPAQNLGPGGGGAPDMYLKNREEIAKEATRGDMMNRYRQSQDEWNMDFERNQIQNDIKKGHIDPHRLFSDMGTGEKIGTFLGLALSGMGSGLTGQPNAALQMLNKHIDNDIKSQEAEMGKNQNLLRANMEQTKDLRSAREMTRVMQRDLMADKLQEVETNSKDPFVRSRAALLKNQITLQNAQTSAQLKMWQQMQGGGSQNMDPASRIRQLSVMGMMPKEDKQAADKELANSQRIDKLRNDVESSAKLLDSKLFAGKLTPSSRASAVNTFAGILAKEAEGRFNLEEAKNQMNALMPEPGDLASTRQEKALHRKQFFDSFNNYPVLDQYGLKQKEQQQAPAQIRSFRPMGK